MKDTATLPPIATLAADLQPWSARRGPELTFVPRVSTPTPAPPRTEDRERRAA